MFYHHDILAFLPYINNPGMIQEYDRDEPPYEVFSGTSFTKGWLFHLTSRESPQYEPVCVSHSVVGACRTTAADRFLKRADVLADEALRVFWSDGPLPRASSRHSHYEAITRAYTLALALLELWSIHGRLDRPLVFLWIDR